MMKVNKMILYKLDWSLTNDGILVDNFSGTALISIDEKIEDIDSIYISHEDLSIVIKRKDETLVIIKQTGTNSNIYRLYHELKNIKSQVRLCHKETVCISVETTHNLMRGLVKQTNLTTNSIMELFDELYKYKYTFYLKNNKLYITKNRTGLILKELTDDTMHEVDTTVLRKIELYIYTKKG